MSSPKKLMSGLWKIRGSFTDVTLRCQDGNSVKAHKIVLSAASKTLNDLCAISDDIGWTNVSLESVTRLIEYIYTGQRPVDLDSTSRRELARRVGVEGAGSFDVNKKKLPLITSLEEPDKKKLHCGEPDDESDWRPH